MKQFYENNLWKYYIVWLLYLFRGKICNCVVLLALHKYCFLEKYCEIYILLVAFTILSGDTKAGQCVQ